MQGTPKTGDRVSGSNTHCSSLAQRPLVPETAGDDSRRTPSVGQLKADSEGSQDGHHSGGEDQPIGGLQSEGRRLQKEGFSSDAINLIQNSTSAKSATQYKYKWDIFVGYCESRRIDPFEASENVISNFLAFVKKERKIGYSTLCGYRSAISRFHKGISGVRIGDLSRIQRTIKGAWRQSPPLPKYTKTWNVQTVLDYLRKQHPPSVLDDSALSHKTITLVALTQLLR